MSDCSMNAFKVPEKPKLKGCPFCGGEVEVDNPMPDYQSGHGFHCLKCGAYFQLGDSDEEAAEAWNKRFYSLYEIKDWSFSNLECCDEPEWTLFTSIYDAVGNYLGVAEGW